MIGHLSTIRYPSHTENFDYEVELAVIIGKKVTKLDTQSDPYDFIFGYTIANDLTARDVQKSEKQWTRGKAFDASLPIGPVIVTKDETGLPNSNDIWLTVNGDTRQLSNTSKMIFDIPFLIHYISQVITLEPGDIILTGTPAGVGYYMDPKATLKPGDQIACGVSGISELRFTISDKSD
jgi:acylpyruvate hydrolase